MLRLLRFGKWSRWAVLVCSVLCAVCSVLCALCCVLCHSTACACCGMWVGLSVRADGSSSMASPACCCPLHHAPCSSSCAEHSRYVLQKQPPTVLILMSMHVHMWAAVIAAVRGVVAPTALQGSGCDGTASRHGSTAAAIHPMALRPCCAGGCGWAAGYPGCTHRVCTTLCRVVPSHAGV
jgi:hypothetical protein